MTPEEPGLLGNLPRSRPGTRSDKRGDGTGSKPAPKRSQAAKPGVKNAAAAKKKAPAAKKNAPKKPPAPKSQPAPEPRPEPVASKSVPPSPSPLESAVKVAGAGLKVAEGVTREVLRRLPRP
ncbi:MAG TPA: hypothetical protein VFY44_00845 [Thermoleophilaceae bacterium]|nr:hypothetical protein [Thermoleophilaceae bacterium]